MHGLLTGGPLGLSKALDQLIVLFRAALKIGHISTMVGVNSIKTGTQPPGILTWAAFTAYNRTGDKEFLATAYEACAQNNRWYFNTSKKGRATTAPSGQSNTHYRKRNQNGAASAFKMFLVPAPWVLEPNQVSNPA